jgi:alpha-ketoglutarate-dependent taurine dioxygenase
MAVDLKGVRIEMRTGEAPLPLLVSRDSDIKLGQWVSAHQNWFGCALVEYGAILFRDFNVATVDAFAGVLPSLSTQTLNYLYRSTPRTSVGENVYTATEYPADASIPMHNENAYQRTWPRRLVFCCTQPARIGGETPLARTAAVTSRLGPELVRMFARRGVMYIRNFGHGVDLSWETTFQTSSKVELETLCRRENIEWKWLSDSRLRTSQVCHGVARHPTTGEELWFNQAHLFHPSGLGPERHKAMLNVFGEDDLPRNAMFGDGHRIEETMLYEIRQAFDEEAVVFSWQKGDLLVLDNMLVAHGRRPYTGSRRILLAMCDPMTSDFRPGKDT